MKRVVLLSQLFVLLILAGCGGGSSSSTTNASSSSTSAVTLQGSWHLTGQTQPSEVQGDFNLTQQGTSVSASGKDMVPYDDGCWLGGSPSYYKSLAGAIGQNGKLTSTIMPTDNVPITLEGTVSTDGSRIVGTWSKSGCGSPGTFTATRLDGFSGNFKGNTGYGNTQLTIVEMGPSSPSSYAFNVASSPLTIGGCGTVYPTQGYVVGNTFTASYPAMGCGIPAFTIQGEGLTPGNEHAIGAQVGVVFSFDSTNFFYTLTQ
jgi:hypothetical protein